MSRLIICADDYGLTPAIGRAVRALYFQRRISATTCMVVSPHWSHEAQLLKSSAHAIETGLHITLTDEHPLTELRSLAVSGHMPDIDTLTRRSFYGNLNQTEIRAEILAQIEAFSSAWGKPPDFIDGHQHCHILPGIRTSVLDIVASISRKCWIRSCEDHLHSITQRACPWRALGSAILSRGLKADAIRRGLKCNDTFAGFRRFSTKFDFAAAFPTYLRGGGLNHLVMCHPGGPEDSDVIGSARLQENQYLSSNAYGQMLSAAAAQLGQFKWPNI